MGSGLPPVKTPLGPLTKILDPPLRENCLIRTCMLFFFLVFRFLNGVDKCGKCAAIRGMKGKLTIATKTALAKPKPAAKKKAAGKKRRGLGVFHKIHRKLRKALKKKQKASKKKVAKKGKAKEKKGKAAKKGKKKQKKAAKRKAKKKAKAAEKKRKRKRRLKRSTEQILPRGLHLDTPGEDSSILGRLSSGRRLKRDIFAAPLPLMLNATGVATPAAGVPGGNNSAAADVKQGRAATLDLHSLNDINPINVRNASQTKEAVLIKARRIRRSLEPESGENSLVFDLLFISKHSQSDRTCQSKSERVTFISMSDPLFTQDMTHKVISMCFFMFS